MLDALPIAVRWIHVSSACALVGSALLYEVGIRPAWLAQSAEARQANFGRALRTLKMTTHITFLLFILSGAFNAVRNWPIYTRNPGLMHGLFGMHLLLGLGGLVVVMMMLAGRELKPARAGWSRAALLLLLLGIAAAATLKSAREAAMAQPPAIPPPAGGSPGAP